MNAAANEIVVPVSIGEVIDKITILRIKSERIADEAKLVNVRKELAALDAVIAAAFPSFSPDVQTAIADLQRVNEKLWVIEDDIRDCERDKDFGPTFIALARAVYVTNDERARLKKVINLALGSTYIEEKSYKEHSVAA